MPILDRMLRMGEAKRFKSYEDRVARINAIEPELEDATLDELKEDFAELRERAANGESLDDLLYESFALTRTAGELSIACPQQAVPGGLAARHGYAALRVAGPLDHSLVGVLAALTSALADAGVPVFALSTYDTDYLLVPGTDLDRALAALRAV